MKTIQVTILFAAAVLTFAGCKQSNSNQQPIQGITQGGVGDGSATTGDDGVVTASDGTDAPGSAPQLQAIVSGDSCRYGDHVYTMVGTFTAEKYNRSATGTVTFTNVPADYQEFEAVYTNFLGKTPHGTAAMMPMAMEMYGRDADEGLRCLQLINYPSNVNSVVSQLKQKFVPSQHAPANDPYIQRYLPAAVLRGATPDNAYEPSYPYTVDMKASVNAHQELQISGSGRVMYIYVMGNGWDTRQRSVEVILQTGAKLHQVFNCPALYTQCKNIHGQWQGLK